MLNHPFIVKFYGAALLEEGNQVRAILVMELCKENLMRHIFLNPMNIPGLTSVSTHSAYRNTIQWAKDIASALEFIHCQRIVHRDLKLENILVRCMKQDKSHLVLWCFNLILRWPEFVESVHVIASCFVPSENQDKARIRSLGTQHTMWLFCYIGKLVNEKKT